MAAHGEEKLKKRWEHEQEFLKRLKEKKPELFVKSITSPTEVLEKIGITAYPDDLPKGYIRYLPQDFIVEEVRGDETVTIEPGELSQKDLDPEGLTYYCDLVKINVPTLDAMRYLAERLGIAESKIQYAGIKDQAAITSQKISIREIDENQLAQVELPSIFIKNCQRGKGAITVGDLDGNRFTIMVRTGQNIIEGRLKKRVDDIKKDGILNFYGMQRFGMPRLLSHELGRYILAGQFEKAVKTFLIWGTPYELPVVAHLRYKARKLYGDWAGMKELYFNLPYTLRYELAILDYLERRPDDFSGALRAIGDQTKIWIYAYNSYLFNQILAAMSKNGNGTKVLPTILSPNAQQRKIYEPLLKRDRIGNYEGVLNMFNIPRREIFIDTRIYPKFDAEPVVTEHGVVLAFTLPRGAYATNLLSNLFKIYTGWPVPEWVKAGEADSKKLIGLGSVEDLRPKFGEFMVRADDSDAEE